MNIWWKLGGAAVILAAAFLLVRMYGSGQYKRGKADERIVWSERILVAERRAAKQYQAGVQAVLNADKQYIETIREKVVPITKTIIERSTEYAQTPEGASICLPADRVHELESFTSGLFATTPSELLDAVVSANSVGEER